MADKKLSQATSATTVESAALFPILQDVGGGVDNFNATLTQMKTAINQTQGEILTKLATAELSTQTAKTTRGFLDTVYSAASAGGALSINFNNGAYQEITLSGNVTSVTFDNFPLNSATGITLKLIQGGSGSYTVDFTGVESPNGAAPTLSTAVSSADIIGFIVVNISGTVTASMFASGLAMGVI